ncbi:MAG: DUF4395 domain-containing protein [Armatimonadota bacterium]|nr:DUF4395 domain-containing protein [Armatimonadota bacterium]MDW8156585.1 DUF4395 domain-containing protein [Armatimonadota bacterium]
MRDLRRVDHNALRTNQACVVGFTVLAFLLDWPWLVALVAAVMLVGTADPRLALFQQAYHQWLKGRVLQPDEREDDPLPHRFAQGMAGSVLLLAALSLWGGYILLGWILAWLVVVLAAVNLLFGFCAGCFVFYQLARRGFVRSGSAHGGS